MGSYRYAELPNGGPDRDLFRRHVVAPSLVQLPLMYAEGPLSLILPSRQQFYRTKPTGGHGYPGRLHGAIPSEPRIDSGTPSHITIESAGSLPPT